MEITAALGKGVLWDSYTWESISEYVGDNPAEIADRVKLYVQTLQPYLDEILPEKGSNRTTGDIQVIGKKIQRERHPANRNLPRGPG